MERVPQAHDVAIDASVMDEWIVRVCDGIKTLLQKRQLNYGNTIGSPLSACSRLGPLERAKVYIDQKLARLMMGDDKTAPDTLMDVVGYAILMRALEYGQGREFNDPLSLYIRFNETRDEALLEPAARFAHEKDPDPNVSPLLYSSVVESG